MGVRMMQERQHGIALAMTGASGFPYGLRLLECLLQMGERVDLVVSDAARVVCKQETDLDLPLAPDALAAVLAEHLGAAAGLLRAFGLQDWFAPMASGSNAPRALVICPCSGGTLSAVASGASGNLIERAADVMLKEGRRLILVPRETPLSAVHLENMLKLARLGVIILPASPGFYHRPRRVEDMVDFVVARILSQLGIDHHLGPRWGGVPS